VIPRMPPKHGVVLFLRKSEKQKQGIGRATVVGWESHCCVPIVTIQGTTRLDNVGHHLREFVRTRKKSKKKSFAGACEGRRVRRSVGGCHQDGGRRFICVQFMQSRWGMPKRSTLVVRPQRKAWTQLAVMACRDLETHHRTGKGGRTVLPSY